METTFGSLYGVYACKATDGRQLGEGNVVAHLAEGTPIDWEPGLFGGARKGCSVNPNALEQILANWTAILNDVDSIRTHVLARLQRDPSKKPTVVELYAIAEVCISVPAYLMRRGVPVIRDGEIPVSLASLTKVVAGIRFTALRILERGRLSGLAPSDRLSAEFLTKYVEEHALHVSESDPDLACSASDRMIEEAFRMCIEGCRPGDSGTKPFGGLIADMEECVEYGLAVARADLLNVLHRLEIARICGSLRRPEPDDLERPLGGLIVQMLDAQPKWMGADMQIRATLAQRDLEESLAQVGWCAPEIHVTEEARAQLAKVGASAVETLAPSLAPVLRDYCLLERAALGRAHACQSNIHAILARSESPAVSIDDVNRLVPNDIRHILARAIKLQLKSTDEGGLIVQHGYLSGSL